MDELGSVPSVDGNVDEGSDDVTGDVAGVPVPEWFCAEIPVDRVIAMATILIILFITAYLMMIFFTAVPDSPEMRTM
jgi:hypothetical protein